jgi:hypothetical protein
VHRDDIVGSETWTAETGPHYLESTITVKGTLTIEACARVIMSKGVSVYVGSSSDAGRLITNGVVVVVKDAMGTETTVLKPVTFEPASEDEYWGMVFVNGQGEAEFNLTVFAHGGDLNAISTSVGGTLVARGPNDGTLKRMIAANGVVVSESASFGVTLESGAGFKEGPDSMLSVQGTGRLPKPALYSGSVDPRYPVFVEPPGVGSLPPGEYLGSPETADAENNKILVVPFRAIAGDEQFRARGVPYLIRGDFYMQPTTKTTSTLTIEAGVQLRFYREATSSTRYVMQIGDGASIDPRPVTIDIRGTAEKPVVFTSDAQTPQAGDWVGLYLDCSPPAGNVFEHAQVLYAGAPSGTNSYGCGPKANDAAILITDWRPDNAFITKVEISNSAGSGIMSGWSSDSDGPNLKVGNVFEAMGNACHVTRWKNSTGVACPDRTDDAPLCL